MPVLYKNLNYLNQSDSDMFEKLYEPGEPTVYSGVYRCEACGKNITCVAPQPLPPANHHPHSMEDGRIRWRLVVWG